MATTTRLRTITIPGVTGATIFYRALDQDGGTLVARTSSGVTETPAGSGIYTKKITTWDVDWVGQEVWDNGSDIFASEAFDKLTTPSAGAVALTSSERNSVAAAIFDLSDALGVGYTFRKVMKGLAAVLLGKSSSDGNTFRDPADTKNVVVATVDADANRTAVTLDLT